MQKPNRPCSADEEYMLPPVEALLAGTLALMTGCAQTTGNLGMRTLMAGKVVSNLVRLSKHPDLSPTMRCMLTRLSLRWSNEGLADSARSPTSTACH